MAKTVVDTWTPTEGTPAWHPKMKRWVLVDTLWDNGYAWVRFSNGDGMQVETRNLHREPLTQVNGPKEEGP